MLECPGLSTDEAITNYPSRLTSSSDLSGVILLLFEGTDETLFHTVFADLGIRACDDNAFDVAGSANCAGLLECVHGVGAVRSSDVGVLNGDHWNDEVVDLRNEDVVSVRIKDVVVLSSEHHIILISASVGVLRHDQVLRRGDVGRVRKCVYTIRHRFSDKE